MEDFLIADIEIAMLALLQRETVGEDGAQPLTEFDIAQGVAGINKPPAICVRAEDIDHRPVTDTIVAVNPTMVVYLVFRSERGADARRRGIYPVVEATVQLLSRQCLGMDIDPLTPGRATEVTSEELAESGMVAYRIPFKTGFEIERNEESDPAELLRIGINYFLQPDDSVADATDDIVLHPGVP